MLNPFFLQGSKSEQNLIQDLVNEHLKIFGVDIHYIPRKYITEKTIIKEVIESKFDEAFPLEAYVDTYDGYDGQGTLLSKFGIQLMNDLTLIISKERFEDYITPLIEGTPNIKLSTRPKEGDLIYFPLGDRLFEIKYVEHEKPFYQLQKNYVYELKCELFRYGDEVLNVGIDEIDDNVESEGYITTLSLVGVGSTATATASIVNGGVRLVTVTNRGTGYESAPNVVFSKSSSFGGTAIGVATMISGIVDFCETDSNLKRVQGVEITNAGYGYTVAPMVAFSGGGGKGASAIADIGDGIVGVITVTSGGSGYVTPPTISFIGVSSISASARAVLNESGTITQIRIVNSGLGYTQAPSIVIGNPYLTGGGTYESGETVTGSVSGVTAIVKSWDAETKSLKVSNLTGSFIDQDTIVGSASSAMYKILSKTQFNVVDPYNSSDEIEVEADAILDFTERNPFGMP